ncbi:glucose/arabinose dehydrogenase [Kineococcus xinjiangensis]|uniref:Glucose/arabinose dehydrogenase n=1 Tax=Kineococcus xinjiangensis TaxID=512762 RepID=A0A2S6IW78_9ACTN|nr:PQQ-dependent sugar dehydrogenase [Kineococcus xinjiangensis]PPK98614.1 glucose/arabinose dehydrogenase [Kineococcus xinjiangensis]
MPPPLSSGRLFPGRPGPGRRGPAAALVAMLALAAGAGCTAERTPTASAPSPAPPSPSSSGPEQPTPPESPTASPEPGALPAGVPGRPQDIATGLDVPWDVAVLPDGTAFVTLRNQARVLRVGPGSVSAVPAPGPDGRVPDVAAEGEGGLLGIALSPQFEQDNEVFLYLTTRQDNRVVRMTHRDGRLINPEVVLSGIPRAKVHNGGRIRFGPDGMLYVATGDAADRTASQDPRSLGGKILRMTPDGQAPEDNPTPGSLVYSLGHRNVQGLGWDSAGRLYASEFGQNEFDELNLIRPGANYGWPEVEGADDGGGRFELPLQTWTPEEASPSGIAVTDDAVWVASLRGERLWRVPLTPDGATGTPEPYLEDTLGRLRSVDVGPDGTLWLLTSNTFRGELRPGDDRLVSLPLQ